MIFCENCFEDSEVIEIIRQNGRTGNCPVCGAKNTKIYDTDKDKALYGIFDDLLSLYTIESDLPKNYPKSDIKSLSESLRKDWNIFSCISDENISEISKNISPDIYSKFKEIFLEPVGIIDKYNKDVLKKIGIFRTFEWDVFKDAIQHKNRFHNNMLNDAVLKLYCMLSAENITENSMEFYRGRISARREGHKCKDICAPPMDKAVDGRANSAGISRLYLTDNIETTLHEIRAAEYDYVTIGTFKLCRPIRIVNLKQIGMISPFKENVDCRTLAVNRSCMSRINEEMRRPMRRGDSSLEYIPTQFIVDYIQSIVDENNVPFFDGIKYQSAMHSAGSNYTIFDPSIFKCTGCKTYEVTRLEYKRNLIN